MGTSSQWGVAALSASLCHLDEVKIPAVFIFLFCLCLGKRLEQLMNKIFKEMSQQTQL